MGDPTWSVEVYPARGSFSFEVENPEEKEDVGARAAQRVGVSNLRSKDAWQEG